MERAVDGSPRGKVTFRQLAETLTGLPILEDGCAVQVEGLASYVLTLELGPPHAGTDPLDDETPLKPGDDPDDDDHRPAQRPPVSICSRNLMNSMVGRFSSSRTSRKCLVNRAVRSQAQTRTTSK